MSQTSPQGTGAASAPSETDSTHAGGPSRWLLPPAAGQSRSESPAFAGPESPLSPHRHWLLPGGAEQATPEAPASARTAPPPLRAHRRWLLHGLAPVGLLTLIVLVVIALTSAGEEAPATGAAALVPSDALVYIHVSTDPTRSAVRQTAALLGRLPGGGGALTGLAQRMVAVVGGSPATSFARDIRPWIGPEAAFALLNTSGASAGSVIVVAVRDHARAASFITRAGAQRVGSYRGDALWVYPTGAELAFVGQYLVAGQDASVRAAIDVEQGLTPSLTANSAYTQATGDEPAGRVLDAYLSSAGVTRVLDSRGGAAGELGTVLSQPALLGSALSISPQTHGLAVFVHSALDPGVASSDSTRLQSFSPTLPALLPAATAVMFDARNLSAFGPTMLTDLGRVGLLSAVPDILRRVGSTLRGEGVGVGGVLSLFSGETAVALIGGAGSPAPVIVTRTPDEAAARVKLAAMEAPLTQIFSTPSTSAGAAPVVNDVQIDGVTVHELALGPGLTLDYAVTRGLIILSTRPQAIGAVIATRATLADTANYRRAVANVPSSVTSLGFANFSQLLSLGEQTTLAKGANFPDFLPFLQRIRALGMDSTSDEADSNAEFSLQIP